MADFPPENHVEEDETTEEEPITDQVVPSDAPTSPVMYNPNQYQVVPPLMYNPHQYQAFPNAVPASMMLMLYGYQHAQAFHNAVQGQAPLPMMPNYQQDQAFPNPVPGQALMIRPTTNNQNQDHVVPSLVSGQVPMIRPRTNYQNQDQDYVVPNGVPGQAPMIRPTTNNQNQDHVNPNGVPGQAPMIRPTTNNQNQDHVSPNGVPGQALMIRPVTNNQNHPMANQMANQNPMQPPFPLPPNHTYNPRPVFTAFSNPLYQNNVTPFTRIQYPYLRPEDNHQNLVMPQFRSDQMFTRTLPSGEVRSYVVVQDPLNPQQYCVMSLDDAVVIGPSPQQQLQPNATTSAVSRV